MKIKICKKRYSCIDCNNLIDDTTFHYGKGRCKSCANTDELNPNYIDGRSINISLCIDCGNPISSYKSKRCLVCHNIFNVGKNNSTFRDAKIMINCDFCNNTIFKYNSHIKEKNFCNNECRGKWNSENIIGKNHPHFGKRGKNSPNYIHGQSRFPYTFKFNQELKNIIRIRDNFECQNCGLKEINHFRGNKLINLIIHHIDYNKENCKETNLITTCHVCNIIANFNRDYWFAYYTYIMENFK